MDLINNKDLSTAFDLGVIDLRTLYVICRFARDMGIKVSDDEKISLTAIIHLIDLVTVHRIPNAGTKVVLNLRQYLNYRYNQ